MRPNRIGIYPVTLNDNTVALTNSRVTLDGFFDSESDLHANMTSRAHVELYSGISGDIHSTVYSRQFFYGGGQSASFTNSGNPLRQRFSIGGFISLDGLRVIDADPRPLYVRFQGSAHATMKSPNKWLQIEPIIGLKANTSTPSNLYSDAAKLTRRLSSFVELNTNQSYATQYGTNEMHSFAAIDTTFALAQYFHRTGGVGIPANQILGVGWSFLLPTIISNESVDIQGPWIINIHAWVYTADFDMFDPNKN